MHGCLVQYLSFKQDLRAAMRVVCLLATGGKIWRAHQGDRPRAGTGKSGQIRDLIMEKGAWARNWNCNAAMSRSEQSTGNLVWPVGEGRWCKRLAKRRFAIHPAQRYSWTRDGISIWMNWPGQQDFGRTVLFNGATWLMPGLPQTGRAKGWWKIDASSCTQRGV